jgi:hypothetical protein
VDRWVRRKPTIVLGGLPAVEVWALRVFSGICLLCAPAIGISTPWATSSLYRRPV